MSVEAPEDWDPNHGSLHATNAPHETGAVLRAFRIQGNAPRIGSILGMNYRDVVKAMGDQLDEEGRAHAAGRPIYDARIPRGTT